MTDIKVFISSRESVCSDCGEKLGRHAWINLVEEDKVLCLACADLDHLVYLPSGDATLTRRSNKYSNLSAVVLQWSRSRSRYERQGILVEEAALQKAEQECLADADVRARRRERDADRRQELDQEYMAAFAVRVRQMFPGCPDGRDRLIAEHACQKYSGRVGRSASAKNLDKDSVLMAVKAHIRHAETSYDRLLSQGVDREDARFEIKPEIDAILKKWKM